MLRLSDDKSRKLKVSLAKRVIFRGRNYDTKTFFHRDSVAVFPELRLCFNRIKKSGNSSVCLHLSKLCGYPDYDTPEDLKDRLPRPETLSVGQLFSLRSYHSLAVVRNPYERALSAFLEKVASGTSAQFAHYPGFGEAGPDGFLKFLTYLEASQWQVNRHFWPQTLLMYKPVDAYSLVARLEDLPEVLPPFIRRISGRDLDGEALRAPHPVERRQKRKVTTARRKVDDFYTPGNREIVERIYGQDFRLLNYSPGVLSGS